MTEEDAVSIASWTRFGDPGDSKSAPTFHASKGLAESGMLHRLYVIHVEDAMEIPDVKLSTPIPGGRMLPGMIYLPDYLLPVTWYDRRQRIIDLFDFFVSRTIGSEEVLQTFLGMTRTLSRANKQGITTAVYASSPHPESTLALFSDEATYFGSSLTKGIPDFSTSHDRADYIVCLSEYSRSTFVKAGFDENCILNVGPLGVDLNAYRPSSPPEDKFVVLMVANMTGLKGARYLLDAWDLIEIPQAELKICGAMSSPIEPVLMNRINGMENVTYVGQVDDPEPYYQEASVLVHPSLTEGGLSKVILEAMASALPTVVTEHSGAEYIHDSGYVVPIRDPDAIANRIRNLFDNPKQAVRMGERGRSLVEEQYTWDDFSERVRKAHEKILDERD